MGKGNGGLCSRNDVAEWEGLGLLVLLGVRAWDRGDREGLFGRRGEEKEMRY